MHNSVDVSSWFNVRTPLVSATLPISGYKALIKRDDLIHPTISGNKWRKLKGYLNDNKPLITSGGLHSNHLHAFAYLSEKISNPCFAIIRAEDTESSHTVDKLKERNVTCLYLNRTDYRKLRETEDPWLFFADLPQGRYIPEGGKGERALVGLVELAEELNLQLDSKASIIVAAGTGTTAAGLSLGLSHKHSILVVKMFQDGGIEKNIESLIGENDIRYLYSSELKKFAERHKEVENYIAGFYRWNSILLDPVYNGRMVYYIDRLIAIGTFIPEGQVVFYHCGGLQGFHAYRQRYPASEESLSFLNHLNIQ